MNISIPTVTERIDKFLDDTKNENNADLVARWSPTMETQVNIDKSKAQLVEDTKSTYRYTHEEGFTVDYWPIRIPKNADTNPSWYDYKLDGPLHWVCEGVGMTGWDYNARVSRWVGFDFDSISGHGEGLSDEQLAEIKQKVCDLDYAEIRNSTGGKGIHVYVHVESITTANHTVHAQLGKAVLDKMSRDCGFDFAGDVDACGVVLWIWHQKMKPENGGLALIKAAQRPLAEDELPNWRENIKPKSPNSQSASDQMTSGELIKRAMQYVANCNSVKQGGRNTAAFSIAGHLRKFVDADTGARLSENRIVELMRLWNMRNTPPIDDDELRSCVANAINHGSPREDEIVEPPVDLDAMFGDRSKHSVDVSPQRINKYTFAELRTDYPTLSPPVIDGLIREGETCNIISYSKIGKSWLAYGLALSVITGKHWLDHFATNPGPTLYIDNELHKNSLANRIPAVADALGIPADAYANDLEIWPLRGSLRSLGQLAPEFAQIERGQFKLIILDAAYRFHLEGVSENDNAAMAQFYNGLDRIAEHTGAAIVLVHHTSKGNQSNKRVTDVGAGAGAQSRAADCHLVLREHKNEGTVVLDAAVRSFKPVEPMTLLWDWPLWKPVEADPALLKTEPTRNSKQQAANDLEGLDAITRALETGPANGRELRRRTGFSDDKMIRLTGMLVQCGRVKLIEGKGRGGRSNEYHLAS